MTANRKLTPEQAGLCQYFNKCFLESMSNPITMSLWITKKFDVKERKKENKICLGPGKRKKQKKLKKSV